jgi:dephospho-CoA kinase
MEQPKAASGPFVLGLTGSIGMGKSTVSNMLRDLGVPVLEADAVVHKLYAQGGAAVQPVGQLFPSAVKQGAVDRGALSQCVVGNEAAMKQLEAVVHPLVEQERLEFLKQVTWVPPSCSKTHTPMQLCVQFQQLPP